MGNRGGFLRNEEKKAPSAPGEKKKTITEMEKEDWGLITSVKKKNAPE